MKFQLQMWQNMEQKAQEEKKQLEKKLAKQKKEKEEKKSKGLEEIKEEGEDEQEEGHKTVLPDWLEKYILYKFNLYDRTGNKIR